ncbi:MAG: cupin domain-containing protein [Candidatus Margulisbacteria bacterium]|nr:cupin domain-containing protein [Candidatus Margulisiibacteriota bacterium]
MDKFINKVLNLADNIEYSSDSIVSKIIYKSEHTILTLFALAEGQSIAEHVTPFDAQVQILEGEAELEIGGEKKVVKNGESIIMPANVPHSLYAKKAYKMLLTMMK